MGLEIVELPVAIWRALPGSLLATKPDCDGVRLTGKESGDFLFVTPGLADDNGKPNGADEIRWCIGAANEPPREVLRAKRLGVVEVGGREWVALALKPEQATA